MRWFLILAVMGLATHGDDVSGAPLEIPALTKRVVFQGYQLAPEEVSLLNSEFKKLKPAKKMFFERAEHHLLCFASNSREPEPFALFMKDRLVFRGYDVDAWTERMEGTSSECYVISDELYALLQSWEKKAKAKRP